MIGFSRRRKILVNFFLFAFITITFDKFRSQFAGFNNFIACVVLPFIQMLLIRQFYEFSFHRYSFRSKLASCPLFEFLPCFLFQQVASMSGIYTVLIDYKCVLSHPTVLYGKNNFDFCCQFFHINHT